MINKIFPFSYSELTVLIFGTREIKGKINKILMKLVTQRQNFLSVSVDSVSAVRVTDMN